MFNDKECNVVDSSKDVGDYLVDGDGYQMKLSHYLLKSIYYSDSCISCLEPTEEDENEDKEEDEDAEEEAPATAEVCQNLFFFYLVPTVIR